MQTLTRRQNEIYLYLLEHAQAHEFAPSIDEICLAMGVKSRGSMHKHIQALINANLIEPFNGLRRGIKLSGASSSDQQGATSSFPLLGKIAAGIPLEAIENPEMIQVPAQLDNGKACFVLTVKGESMIDAGIHDGDWVIIEKTSQVRNGEIVVALIDSNEATLKRFEKNNDRIILHPENRSMTPMVFNSDEVQIQGKLVGLMRKNF